MESDQANRDHPVREWVIFALLSAVQYLTIAIALTYGEWDPSVLWHPEFAIWGLLTFGGVCLGYRSFAAFAWGRTKRFRVVAVYFVTFEVLCGLFLSGAEWLGPLGVTLTLAVPLLPGFLSAALLWSTFIEPQRRGLDELRPPSTPIRSKALGYSGLVACLLTSCFTAYVLTFVAGMAWAWVNS